MEDVARMLDNVNIMTGKKTTDQIKEELGQKAIDRSIDIAYNKLVIPADFFKEFTDINIHNEEDFEYLVS